MTAGLFDGYMAVDWSAAGTPRTGADSIWIACTGWGGEPVLENPPTRIAAMARIEDLLTAAKAAGRRLLCGFDFPFGYPAGTARAIAGSPGWSGVWSTLADLIDEGPKNTNNRFDAAGRLNAAFAAPGPFWGNGLKRDVAGLPRTKPDGWGANLPPNRRHAEGLVRSAQEVWKLIGVGSVGGQALTGIAALERLRRRQPVRVWPFETLGEGAESVLAEIYPSLLPPDPEQPIKDAGQVVSVVRRLKALDDEGALAGHLRAPAAMPKSVREEEALILGMEAPAAFRGAASTAYLNDPAAIYAKSFATIRAEADLDDMPEDVADLAVRVIHACGMPDVASDLRYSDDVVAAARGALAAGRPIFCDARMVASGIIARGLPADNPVICTIADPAAAVRAKADGTTRSAAAVDLWDDRLDGAVVVIGNAPTALFRLMERLDKGGPRPAAILAFPVGFVGAAESKAALAADPRGVPFVALQGRRGGSAMAAAALNACTLGLRGDGT